MPNREINTGGNAPAEKEDGGMSKICGVVMPISECENKGQVYSKKILADIRTLIEDAIHDAGLIPKVVWESDTSHQIKPTIVQNIRNFKYFVCVICGLNANALLELGMAIAFNKHVVILTDEKSKYPFDVNDTACIDFPLMQSYNELGEVKQKIIAQLKNMQSPGYQTFLSYFGNVKPADNINPEYKVDLPVLVKMMEETRCEVSALSHVIRNRFHRDAIRSDTIMSNNQNIPIDIKMHNDIFTNIMQDMFTFEQKLKNIVQSDRKVPPEKICTLLDEYERLKQHVSLMIPEDIKPKCMENIEGLLSMLKRQK